MVSDDAELVSRMIADSFSDARERAGAVGAMYAERREAAQYLCKLIRR